VWTTLDNIWIATCELERNAQISKTRLEPKTKSWQKVQWPPNFEKNMPLIHKSSPLHERNVTRNKPSPFIVGLGRSGTTLLRLMMDAHPELAIPPETQFIPALIEACRKSENPRETYLNELSSHRVWADQHIEIDLLRQTIELIDPFDLGDALRAFYQLYAHRFNKLRWGDKSAYLRVMYLIQELLSEARFIHIIRDGRDVALSINDLWWGPSSVQEAATWWLDGITKARSQLENIKWYLEIRFEDLVIHTQSTLKTICNFIDLTWHPGMLEYYKSANVRLAELTSVVSPDGKRLVPAEERRKIHIATTRPPQASHIGQWKIRMTKSDRASFEMIAGDMLRDLGYEVG
jgi:hypothetical protein